MTRVDRSNTNLNEQLQWQLDFLHTSLERYEAGHEHEAIRVAVILRIMCHDHGSNSRSLLGQLGHKTAWSWFDTSRVGNHPPMQWGFLQIEHPIGYEPRFGAPVDRFDPASQKWVDFDSWWTNPLIRDNDQNRFSRKDLVTFVADQDGGAHVDPTLEENYNTLSRGTSLGYHGRTSKVVRLVRTPVWEAIRQTAYEFERSAQHGLSHGSVEPVLRVEGTHPTWYLRALSASAGGDPRVGTVTVNSTVPPAEE